MDYFYRLERRITRWDRQLNAWVKRRKKKTPKQKKKEFQKRCNKMYRRERAVSPKEFQERYEDIFNGTIGRARRWRIIWKLWRALRCKWKLAKDYVNARYQHSVNKERIMWMQKLNYVFTFTYDEKKCKKNSFYKELRRTLKHLGWQYIGVWKHTKTGNRLYFYAAIMINEEGMAGTNVKIKEFQRKAGKRITVVKNKYFTEKFGSTVVNPLRRENRKLWKIILVELNKRRAKINTQGIDKNTFIGDYEQWLRKKKHRRRTWPDLPC